jgi:hypothetical protein
MAACLVAPALIRRRDKKNARFPEVSVGLDKSPLAAV